LSDGLTDPDHEGDLRSVVVHIFTSTNLLQHCLEDGVVVPRSGLVPQPLTPIAHWQPCLAAVEVEIGRFQEALTTGAEVYVALETQAILWHLQAPAGNRWASFLSCTRGSPVGLWILAIVLLTWLN